MPTSQNLLHPFLFNAHLTKLASTDLSAFRTSSLHIKYIAHIQGFHPPQQEAFDKFHHFPLFNAHLTKLASPDLSAFRTSSLHIKYIAHIQGFHPPQQEAFGKFHPSFTVRALF